MSPIPTPQPYHNNLLTSLTTINTHNPPVHTCSTGWSFNGLISGPTSIAYLFWKLSTLYPGYVFKGQEFGEWAECYLELGRYVVSGGGEGVGVGCEGVAGRVVRGVVEGDEGVVGEVCGLGTSVTCGRGDSGGVGKGENDWPNGRAGCLYLLRVLRSRFPNSRRKIQMTIDRVVDAIVTDKEFQQPLSIDSIYTITSTITQIILSRTQNHTDGLEEVLNNILALQNPDGNWNETNPWIINSLASISQYLPPPLRSKVTNATDRARSLLFHADSGDCPPTLQPNGLVTRTLAFTDPDDERFHEVIRMISGEWLDERRPGWRVDAGKKDEWVGLWTGEAGRAWGWVVAELSSAGGGGEGGIGNGIEIERRILGYNDV